jgi:hypothetical protein
VDSGFGACLITHLSCIIRNALLWVQSPLARRGDFSLVAYVVWLPIPEKAAAIHIPVGITTHYLTDA